RCSRPSSGQARRCRQRTGRGRTSRPATSWAAACTSTRRPSVTGTRRSSTLTVLSWPPPTARGTRCRCTDRSAADQVHALVGLGGGQAVVLAPVDAADRHEAAARDVQPGGVGAAAVPAAPGRLLELPVAAVVGVAGAGAVLEHDRHVL